MPIDPERLLGRLDRIGDSLAGTGHAVALIGLGSVGADRTRLDACSDLDFFVVVEPGCKAEYLDDLGWLRRAGPIAYAFANTRDGYKALFEDGIFCEFAVFEPEELRSIPFADGRVVWKRPEWPEDAAQPASPPVPATRDRDWLLGEALTNLLVGLARQRRGEMLSACRFIQGYAVDRVVELAAFAAEPDPAVPADPFSGDRRFERRYPGLAGLAATWLQGYARNRESGLAILAFLEGHFDVNPAIASAIRAYCRGPEEEPGPT